MEQRCNNLKFEDTVRPVKFPDVFPSTLPYKNRFSMIAGDFLEVCSEEGFYVFCLQLFKMKDKVHHKYYF